MVPTFKFGKVNKEFFLELSSYSLSKQPKIILAVYPCLAANQKTVITYELPSYDLRAYDADFAFKRRHALIRKSGRYLGMFQALTALKIIKPTESGVVDNSTLAVVCGLNLDSFVILPEEISDTLD